MSEVKYRFQDLPLDDMDPGTTLLVAGPTPGSGQRLALQLISDQVSGRIIITTTQPWDHILDDCRQVGVEMDEKRTAILDCVAEKTDELPTQVVPLASPKDLTGIGMRFSDVCRELEEGGVSRIRTGLYSASTLLTLTEDLKTVSRFVHTIASRVDSANGLAILLIDPESHDQRVVKTLAQFCDGRIDVQETDDQPELRVQGLPEQESEWTPFRLS